MAELLNPTRTWFCIGPDLSRDRYHQVIAKGHYNNNNKQTKILS